ncbi:pro-corazonin [Musca vetustissima]|uniref:pro-corazonin n=1 Tax=Musca vetustissima TaxID=27455 RepID=UPI002AB7472B|nr:pro-corazonin [Musca vetustissima]
MAFMGQTFQYYMLRVLVLLFFFSMACMAQTFQYSRGWTNGKRNGAGNTATNVFHREDEGLPEIFDIQDVNERRLERCLLQLQHALRNPLLLRSTAAALALNPLSAANQNGNRNSNNNNLGNNGNNPLLRSHQSNELFEELNSSLIDANDDYGKH